MSQPALNGKWCRAWPPALMIHWDSFPFSRLKTVYGWAESLELISGLESSFSPDFWLFWLKQLSFLPTLASQVLAFELWAAKPESSYNRCSWTLMNPVEEINIAFRVMVVTKMRMKICSGGGMERWREFSFFHFIHFCMVGTWIIFSRRIWPCL